MCQGNRVKALCQGNVSRQSHEGCVKAMCQGHESRLSREGERPLQVHEGNGWQFFAVSDKGMTTCALATDVQKPREACDIPPHTNIHTPVQTIVHIQRKSDSQERQSKDFADRTDPESKYYRRMHRHEQPFWQLTNSIQKMMLSTPLAQTNKYHQLDGLKKDLEGKLSSYWHAVKITLSCRSYDCADHFVMQVI
eukprot:1159974-Pelagomonas_calceolata.AAC.2